MLPGDLQSMLVAAVGPYGQHEPTSPCIGGPLALNRHSSGGTTCDSMVRTL